MKLEELYTKFDEIVNGVLNVSPIQHFVFDLTDENSQKSLKNAFPGIEQVLMPESGNYLVIAPIVENENILVLLFPEQTNENLSLMVFDTESQKHTELTTPVVDSEGEKLTIDNFMDFSNKEEVATRFNEFVFNPDGQNSTDEVKDIGSFDVSNDEPVEVNNNNTTTTDNEETEMKFKPIQDEDTTKWVEIPDTNAKRVTVEDGEAPAQEDPFADEAPAQDAPAPEGDANANAEAPAPEGGDANAEAPAQDAQPAADGTGDAAPAEEAPVEEPAPESAEIEDPKAKMRELLAYYTNYMTELVQDPNTSTELISATQEMIDSLIKNMESADGIEEVKADAEADAKKAAAKKDTTATEEPVSEGKVDEGWKCGAAGAALGAIAAGPIGAAIGGGIGAAVEESQEDIDAKIDAEVDAAHANDWQNIQPATSDDVLVPGDLRNSPVNDVDLSDQMPTPDEDLMATSPDLSAQPTSDVLDDVTPVTPEEEDDLLGADDNAMVGADGLPLDTFDGNVDDLATVPAEKKIAWSTDYATNGVATSDDNKLVVPEVLKELSDYYTKVANDVSKCAGKEDLAMKLQKVQILSQTIANEWNSIVDGMGDCCCANSYDRSNMTDLEKDELDNQEGLAQVGADVAADDEQEEEDELAVNDQIESFVEAFKHML